MSFAPGDEVVCVDGCSWAFEPGKRFRVERVYRDRYDRELIAIVGVFGGYFSWRFLSLKAMG